MNSPTKTTNGQRGPSWAHCWKALLALVAIAAIPGAAAAVTRSCRATGAFEFTFAEYREGSPTKLHHLKRDILTSDMEVVASAFYHGAGNLSIDNAKHLACAAAAGCFLDSGEDCFANRAESIEFTTIKMPRDPDRWRREGACGLASRGELPGLRKEDGNEVVLLETTIVATAHRDSETVRQERTVNESDLVCWKPLLPAIPAVPMDPPEPRLPSSGAPNAMKQPFGITAAALTIRDSQVTTTDRATLGMTAQVTTTGPGKGKARLVHNGAKGPVFDLVFKKGGRQADSSLPPIVVKCPAKSGKTAKKASSSGGTGPQMTGAPPNVMTGTIHLEFVSTPGIEKSKPAAYSVTCKENPEPVTVHLVLPDLRIVKASFSPAPQGTLRRAAASASLVVVIENAGSAPVGASLLRVTGRVGKTERHWSVATPALGAGKSEKVEVQLDAQGEVTLPLKLLVDPQKKIVESDERNNGFSVS